MKNVTQVGRPSRVDFNNNQIDWIVCKLAELGLHVFAIAIRTGLTTSQVTYRLRMAGIRVKDYRDGTSLVFTRIWNAQSTVFKPSEEKFKRKSAQQHAEETLARIRHKNEDFK